MKILYLNFLLLFVSVSNAQWRSENHLDTLFYEHVLDPIKEAPAWLIKDVDEVLPKSDLCLSLPTGKFQTSSLVRLPRFPRNYKSEEKDHFKNLRDYEWRKVFKSTVWSLKAFKNEQESAQFAVAAREPIHKLRVSVSNMISKEGLEIPATAVEVRYVQYVPVERSRSENVWSPGMDDIKGISISGTGAPSIVADPLVKREYVNVPAYRAQPVWLTFNISEWVKPGVYSGTIHIEANGEEKHKRPFKIEVLDKKVPSKKEGGFYLDMWMNPSAIATHYQLTHWSEAHWAFIEKYLAFYANGGGKNITAVVTHEPWHKPWINKTTTSQTYTGYQSMVKWIKTDKDKWKFDFSVFDRYVKTAKKKGIKGKINVFSMTPFHTKQKIIFDKVAKGKKTVKDTLELDIFDDAYEKVWTSFLTAFSKHVKRKKWTNQIQLAFDEKPKNQLNRVFAIIEKVVPKWKNQIVIAGHPEADHLAQELSIGYVFFPGQKFSNRPSKPLSTTIKDRKKLNKITSFYLCAEPAHPNSLTFSPAIESRVIPWLAIKHGVNGYLRWAFNNWTIDPYLKPVYIHTQGDDYVIYPGKDGPVSSIRWELLKEGIEDVLVFKKYMTGKSKEDRDALLNKVTKNLDGRYKKARDFSSIKEIINQ